MWGNISKNVPIWSRHIKTTINRINTYPISISVNTKTTDNDNTSTTKWQKLWLLYRSSCNRPSFQNERSANENLSPLAAQITKITSSMALFFPEMEYQLTKPSGTGGGWLVEPLNFQKALNSDNEETCHGCCCLQVEKKKHNQTCIYIYIGAYKNALICTCIHLVIDN